jgi:hypothetical protein
MQLPRGASSAASVRVPACAAAQQAPTAGAASCTAGGRAAANHYERSRMPLPWPPASPPRARLPAEQHWALVACARPPACPPARPPARPPGRLHAGASRPLPPLRPKVHAPSRSGSQQQLSSSELRGTGGLSPFSIVRARTSCASWYEAASPCCRRLSVLLHARSWARPAVGWPGPQLQKPKKPGSRLAAAAV